MQFSDVRCYISKTSTTTNNKKEILTLNNIELLHAKKRFSVHFITFYVVLVLLLS